MKGKLETQKNAYSFRRKLFFEKGFVSDLKNIIDKWQSSYQKSPLGNALDEKDVSKMRTKYAIAYEQRQKFIKKLQKTSNVSDFQNDINSFIEKYGLGEEWFLTITDYVISYWFFPPSYNLHIKEENGKIVLVLNPDTSLNDIEEAWKTIKKKQEKLSPNFKKFNFTKKSFENLEIAIKDRELRMYKFKRDDSSWDNYKTTDLDMVGEIWKDTEDFSTESDLKKSANLRQIRRRHKASKA